MPRAPADRSVSPASSRCRTPARSASADPATRTVAAARAVARVARPVVDREPHARRHERLPDPPGRDRVVRPHAGRSAATRTTSWSSLRRCPARTRRTTLACRSRCMRHPVRTLLPTRQVARRRPHGPAHHRCDRVLFGAAAPLGLLAPALRAAGARRLVGITHGHECWWAQRPRDPAGAAPHRRRHGRAHLPRRLHAIGHRARAVRGRSGSHGASHARRRPERVPPWVRRGARSGSGTASTADAPVVVCVARLTAAQGPGHAGPRRSRTCWPPSPIGPAAGRRRWQGRASAGPPRRPIWASRPQVVLTGPVPWSATPALLRRRERVRDAMSHPARRARAGGARDRVPRGSVDRAARAGRALGRRAGRGHATGRPGTSSTRTTRQRWPGRWSICSATLSAGARWAPPAGPGSRSPGPGTRSAASRRAAGLTCPAARDPSGFRGSLRSHLNQRRSCEVSCRGRRPRPRSPS